MAKTAWTLAVVAMVGAVVVAPPTGGAPARPAQRTDGCPQPWSPWFQASTYPPPDDLPDLGTSVLAAAREPDTDGDGAPDEITDAADLTALIIQRGDGTVTITPGATHDLVLRSSYGPAPGDLDGDGRDELVVAVDQQGEQYLLPGTTPPGTHAIEDVGVFLDGFGNSFGYVGDQDGDGGDDLAFDVLTAPGEVSQVVYSGADLLAPGAGSSVTAPTPIATFEGTDLVAARFDPAGPTVIITGARTPGGSAVTVHAPGAPIELVAAGIVGEYTGGVGTIGAWVRNGQRLVSISPSDRSGSELAVWNLDDPCGRYVASEAPPTMPAPPGPAPASPVEGSADYTG